MKTNNKRHAAAPDHVHSHPTPAAPIMPAAPTTPPGPQLVSTDRVPIPPSFTPVLLSLYHQQQSATKQIEMLATRLKSLEQEAINAHGELTGLVKGIVIAGGLDQNVMWDLSPDCTHLIKRQ